MSWPIGYTFFDFDAKPGNYFLDEIFVTDLTSKFFFESNHHEVVMKLMFFTLIIGISFFGRVIARENKEIVECQVNFHPANLIISEEKM